MSTPQDNPGYQPIPVSVAHAISKGFQKDIVVILAVDVPHDRTHVTTYGRSAMDKLIAADLAEKLTAALGHTKEEQVVYDDFRLNAAKLKEENDQLRARIQELESAHARI